MKTIAAADEADGIKVLMIVNLDPASGAEIEQEAAKTRRHHRSTTTG